MISWPASPTIEPRRCFWSRDIATMQCRRGCPRFFFCPFCPTKIPNPYKLKLIGNGKQHNHPLVVEPTHLKNMLVKLDHFPKVRGENKKSLKPPVRLDFFTTRFYSSQKIGNLPSIFPRFSQFFRNQQKKTQTPGGG